MTCNLASISSGTRFWYRIEHVLFGARNWYQVSWYQFLVQVSWASVIGISYCNLSIVNIVAMWRNSCRNTIAYDWWLSMSLKTPERMCTICDIRQRHFVVASKYSYIIRIFEYFRNWILESYFFRTNASPNHNTMRCDKNVRECATCRIDLTGGL